MKHFLHIANPISKYFMCKYQGLKSKVLLGLNSGNGLKTFALFESTIIDFSFFLDRTNKICPNQTIRAKSANRNMATFF